MHICFVDRKGAHAVWHLMHSIAARVLEEGGRVSFVRLDDGAQRESLPAPSGVNVVDIAVGGKDRPWHVFRQQRRFVNRFRKFLASESTDIVHSNFCLPGSVARKVARSEFGIPVVTTCHELFGSMNQILQFGVRRTDRYANAIVHISQTVARSYGETIGGDGQPVQEGRQLIYNGVDVDAVLAAVDRSGQRVGQRLVSVGRLVPVKGQALVIEALPELIKTFPEIRYTIVGEGPEKENLLALAQRFDVADRVEFLGWLSHAEAIAQMAQASTVVMPTRDNEGFGLALVEAVLTGTPVVASDIPVFQELVGQGLGGVEFFSDRDSQSLATVLAAVETNSGDAVNLQSIRDLIRTTFSAETMSRQYVALYMSLMGVAKMKQGRELN